MKDKGIKLEKSKLDMRDKWLRIHWSSVDIRRAQLPYFEFTPNLLEKMWLIGGIVKGLRKKHISYSLIADWTKLSLHDVKVISRSHRHSVNPPSNYRNVIERNIKWFLKNRRSVLFDAEGHLYVTELLHTKLSSTKIANGAGISRPLVSYLRSGQRKLDDMRFQTVIQLIDYYKRIRTWRSWNDIQMAGIKFNAQTLIRHRNGKDIISGFNNIDNQNFFYKITISDVACRIVDETPNSTPPELYKIAEKYAMVSPKKRTLDNTQYMWNDLKLRGIKSLI